MSKNVPPGANVAARLDKDEPKANERWSLGSSKPVELNVGSTVGEVHAGRGTMGSGTSLLISEAAAAAGDGREADEEERLFLRQPPPVGTLRREPPWVQ